MSFYDASKSSSKVLGELNINDMNIFGDNRPVNSSHTDPFSRRFGPQEPTTTLQGPDQIRPQLEPYPTDVPMLSSDIPEKSLSIPNPISQRESEAFVLSAPKCESPSRKRIDFTQPTNPGVTERSERGADVKQRNRLANAAYRKRKKIEMEQTKAKIRTLEKDNIELEAKINILEKVIVAAWNEYFTMILNERRSLS